MGLLCQQPLGAADIRSTLHNLTRQGVQVEGEKVCVFCHTPQLSSLDGLRSSVSTLPVWQPSLSSQHSFVIYDDIGRLQFGDKPAVGSQSVACLSCHDANQAFSVQAAQTDHPFGVPYRGYLRGQERVHVDQDDPANTPKSSAKALKSLDDFRLPSRGFVDNRSVWWVSASGVTPFRRRADLPLYARPAVSGEIPFVECSSCHDPHITTKLFLRVDNSGSMLCLTCHDK